MGLSLIINIQLNIRYDILDKWNLQFTLRYYRKDRLNKYLPTINWCF